MQNEPVMGPGTPLPGVPPAEGGQSVDPGSEGQTIPGPDMPSVPGDGEGMGQTPGTTPPSGAGRVALVPHADVEPGSIEPHPYADLLPRMTEGEYGRLRESIALDGQQIPATLFQGKLLDGRNRARACGDVGVPLRVNELVGTEAEALTYVLSANQHRRELTKSQRAVVAMGLLPMVSEEVAQERLEKIRKTWEAKRDAGWWELMPTNLDEADGPTRARAVAADMMGVSDRYVQYAVRVQREDAALLERVRSGQLTLTAAIRQLDGDVADEEARYLASVRRRLNRYYQRLDEFPTLLDRLTQLMDEIRGE